MLYLWLIILLLLNGVWLSLVLFGLPGNWLVVLTTSLFAYWRWDEGVFSGWTLIAVAVLALAGELIEFLAGLVGAKKAGASWRASFAGLFGALIGEVGGTAILPIPILGTIIGACLGAGLAVWAIEINRGERTGSLGSEGHRRGNGHILRHRGQIHGGDRDLADHRRGCLLAMTRAGRDHR